MQIFVKESKIHGLGIIARAKIEKGTVLPESHVCETKNWVLIKENHLVRNDLIYWTNHSCDPNTKLIIEENPKLLALRDINSGEEITYDYGELKSEKINCNCGSKNCKGYFYKRN